jgi:hypothetical protein
MQNNTDNPGNTHHHDPTEKDRTEGPQSEPLTIFASIENPTRKRRGEAAEAAFLAQATKIGLRACTPWGDSERYDLVLDHGHGFWRVQVKCTQRYAEGRYRVGNSGDSLETYTADEIDFVAAHIVPLDLWYIIPIEAAIGRKSLRFYPHGRSKGLLEKYRQAWCLLDCPRKVRGWKDIPALCRSRELPVRCAVCPLRK